MIDDAAVAAAARSRASLAAFQIERAATPRAAAGLTLWRGGTLQIEDESEGELHVLVGAPRRLADPALPETAVNPADLLAPLVGVPCIDEAQTAVLGPRQVFTPRGPGRKVGDPALA